MCLPRAELQVEWVSSLCQDRHQQWLGIRCSNKALQIAGTSQLGNSYSFVVGVKLIIWGQSISKCISICRTEIKTIPNEHMQSILVVKRVVPFRFTHFRRFHDIQSQSRGEVGEPQRHSASHYKILVNVKLQAICDKSFIELAIRKLKYVPTRRMWTTYFFLIHGIEIDWNLPEGEYSDTAIVEKINNPL